MQTWSDQLQRVVSGVADDVKTHQDRIEQIRRDLGVLKERCRDGADDFLLRRISDIEATNRELGARLVGAEDTLREHARQIAERAAPPEDEDPELQGICRELRSRLAEIAE